MRRLLSLAGALGCWLAFAPDFSEAQQTANKEKAEEYVRDALWGLFGPNWNLSIHGGFSNTGRFLLQRADLAGVSVERALSSEGGWHVGGAIGMDILPRVGARLNYTYGEADLAFNTDDGTGATGADLDDLGRIQTHLASIELLRYLLPARSAVTPYGGAGFVATWWVFDQNHSIVQASGGTTQFRVGAMGIIGLQVKLSDHWDVRAEATTASVRNPFTGRESYTALGGATIDEPTRVSKRDFKLAFMYNFSKPKLELPATNADK